MLSKRISTVALGLVLLAAAIPAWAEPDFDVRDAESVDGWHWLRGPEASATWELSLPQGEEPANPRDCEIRMRALVAPGTDAEPGHDKHLTLTVSSRDKRHRFSVFLRSAASDGHGSTAVVTPGSLTRGSDVVALKRLCRFYAESSSLKISYDWRPSEEACCGNDPEHPHHVAVNQDSIEVRFR